MSHCDAESNDVVLSICISTFNRSGYIGESIESIVSQLPDNAELVISDNASEDETESIVREYSERCGQVRYVRHETNLGLDRNFDRAAALACGRYCWLLPDDDPLKPGAVPRVLVALREDPSLVLVNVETRNLDMSLPHGRRCCWRAFTGDRVYGATEMDRLFLEMRQVVRYIGSFIIDKEIWLSRKRRGYDDSLYDYIGIVFQKTFPSHTIFIAEPLICYRGGNQHSWLPLFLETLMFKLPAIVWGLDISNAAKKAIIEERPWQDIWELLVWRAAGFYTRDGYEKVIRPRIKSAADRFAASLVSRIPGVAANTFVFVFYFITRREWWGWDSAATLRFLEASPHFLVKRGGRP